MINSKKNELICSIIYVDNIINVFFIFVKNYIMRTSSDYTFKYLPLNQLEVENISIAILDHKQKIQFILTTIITFDRAKIHDKNYLSELIDQINKEIKELNTFITGRMNRIFDLSPAKVSELKSALIRLE